MGKNREIGKGLKIPWYIPEDFRHFKRITTGKSVIMGLNTFKSLGKPLPNRRNIVLNFEKIDLPGCEVVTSIKDALEKVKHENESFIIGGASIYKQFLSLSDKLYMTYIDHSFDADIFFPEINFSQWQLISEQKGLKDEKNNYDYWFREYVRIRN
jgi:dihydrofolate reductase